MSHEVLLSTHLLSSVFGVTPSLDGAESEDRETILRRYQDRLDSFISRLPVKEADLLYMYFTLGKRQSDIAAIFGITQAAVSYRLNRAKSRIKFLCSVPEITPEGIRKDLSQLLQPIDVDILAHMWETTCQSEVAVRLGLTQGRVRHRFFRAVQKLDDLAKLHPEVKPYSEFFSAVAYKNFNVMREVKLPQWRDRGVSRCG